MRAILAALALLAGVALASACGQSTIDAGRPERLIRGAVVEQVGARVASVSCPEDVEMQEGRTFRCSVTGTDGSKGDVAVRQRDDDGSLRVDAPFLHVREAESVIATEIGKRIRADDVKLACPEIVVVAAGRLFECEATSAREARDVSVRLTDDEGHFRYSVSAARPR